MSDLSSNSNLTKFIDSLIGTPFQWGATGPEAFDCLGFGLAVVKFLTGKTIRYPTFEEIQDFAGIFKQIKEEDLSAGDFIHVKKGLRFRELHIVVVENKEWGAECIHGIGVCRVNLPLLLSIKDVSKEYYRASF